MKKLLIVIALCFVTYQSNSQVLISLLLGDKLNSEKLEFGLQGGLNWMHLGGLDSNDYLTKFNLGFYFTFQMKNPKYYFHTGVLVKSNEGLDHLSRADVESIGGEWQEIEGRYQQIIQSFMVPALMRRQFEDGVYVELGPQFALRSKSYVEYTSDVDGVERNIKFDNKDLINRIDAGVLGGVGYRFGKNRNVAIGARYYQSFVNVYKDRPNTQSRGFFLNVNYPIGVKKAKARREAKKAEEKEAELKEGS